MFWIDFIHRVIIELRKKLNAMNCVENCNDDDGLTQVKYMSFKLSLFSNINLHFKS